MLKKFTFYFLITICFIGRAYSQASKQIFESPNLKSEISSHKTVAILPFDVAITYKKQPKNFSDEANKAQEAKLSSSIQNSMYTYLLRKGKDYTVDFQDIDKTNILLKKTICLPKWMYLPKMKFAKL